MNQSDFPGYAIGYINFASFLIRTAIIDAHKFKLPGTGVDQANDGSKGEIRVGCGQRLAVKFFAIGGFAAVEFGSIPAGVANPSLNRLGGFCFVGYEGCFHHWCDEEHQWHPAYCSPDHEQWFFHKCCFFTTTYRKL